VERTIIISGKKERGEAAKRKKFPGPIGTKEVPFTKGETEQRGERLAHKAGKQAQKKKWRKRGFNLATC